MIPTIKDLFTEEEWNCIKTSLTPQIEEIADFPQTIDCEDVE